MKLAATLIALAVLALSSSAQSLKIVSQKTVYTRKNVGKEHWKRKFTVTTPVLKSHLAPAVRRKIIANLDYWKAFSFEGNKMLLRDEISGTDRWVDDLSYDVQYNSDNILSIRLRMEGSGAYPDTAVRNVVIDTRTGEKLGLQDLLRRESLGRVRDVVREVMARGEATLDADETEGLLEQRKDALYNRYHPDAEHLELKDLAGFSISKEGVSFVFDYGYPHVSQALEPSGEFVLSFADLKPYIRPDGLLARFVR